MTRHPDLNRLVADLEALDDHECQECGDLGYVMIGPDDVACTTCAEND